MNTCTRRILDERTLNGGDTMSLDEAFDLGSFSTLDAVLHVVSPGDGDSPKLTLKHAAFNEEARYLSFETDVAVDLTAAGSTWFRIDAFTRYLGWFLSGTLTSPAVVTVDIVARG